MKYAKNKVLYAFLLIVLLGGAFMAGSWYSHREGSKVNPSVVSSKRLNTEAGTETDLSSLPPGTVRISHEKQQAVGVRIGPVDKKPFNHTLRVPGRISADETLVYRLNAATDGVIQEVFPFTAGSFVEKDQVLASFYTRGLYTFGQTYLSTIINVDRLKESIRESSIQAAPLLTSLQQGVEGLRSLGMGDAQIEEMRRTRKIPESIMLASPVAGFLLTRNVSPSQYFEKGAELYRIADLSRVWIFADLYGREAHYVRPGMEIKASLPDQGKVFTAQVSNVLSQFDPVTRTLKLRLEAKNPGYVLRPDMFVDLDLPVNLPPAITVPADAILDSGLKKTVFVDRGNGFFEPREVEIGWRLGNRVEITKGLKPGERIVISGTFLIDSESRLEMAAAGMYVTMSKDPVCGEDVSINKAEKSGRKSTYQGKTYYFSSDECKEKFDKNPEQYVRKP